ncbi:MAG: hypothetical protein ACTJGY_11510 [Glutamicibacter arilaitensis]|uniref:hypothetical protein n=1 Tax=Glutamicibacter arilaitensis TaxID=256701 RepID=UPI003FD66C0B
MGPISAHARSTFHGEKLNKLVQRSLAVIASGALVFSGVSAATAAPLPTSMSSASIVAAKKSSCGNHQENRHESSQGFSQGNYQA